ncbi:MAG: hypothetical protein ACOCP4_01300 [Candidatus Woesearchaeota archaeon]
MISKDNKGQITLFFILGVIIIITFSFIFYVNERLSQTNRRDTYTFNVDPVVNYAERCIETRGYDLVDYVGYQSGLVDVDREDKNSYIDFGLEIPIWYYSASEDIPELSEIERQLEITLLDEIEECISGFDELNDRYSFYLRGDKEVDVKIRSERVLINLHYPVEISIPNEEDDGSFISGFDAEIRRPLGKFYETAKYITEYQKDNRFLEEMSSEMGSSVFPPTTIELGSRKRWDLSELKRDFINRIHMDLNGVSLVPTEDYYRDEEYYQNLECDLDIDNNTEIDLIYSSDFGMYFDGTPKKGNYVHSFNQRVPSGFGFNVPIPGLQFTHVLFSYNFPLVFSLNDPKTNYTFNFGLETSVLDNEPRQSSSWPDFGFDISSSEFCDIEDDDNEVTIRAHDSFTEDRLNNVSVSFFCGSDCFLGETNIEDDYQKNPSLETPLPECYGGFIVLQKEGYLDEYIQFEETGPDFETDLNYSYPMIPRKEFEIEFDDTITDNDNIVLSFESSYINEELAYDGTMSPNISIPLMKFNFSLYVTVMNGEDIVHGYYNDNLTLDFEEFKDKSIFEIPVYNNRDLNTPKENLFLEIEDFSKSNEPTLK